MENNLNISREELAELDRAVDEAHSNSNTIPENSKTLAINDSISRFSGAKWFNAISETRVLLGGCGGIGSFCALLLSRLHVKMLTIYDDDDVDPSNIGGQFYSVDQVEQKKVNATAHNIRVFSNDYAVNAIPQRFGDFTEPSDIMICGFDNMAARAVFFKRWKQYITLKEPKDKAKCLFIDGRLAAESFQILCIKGDDEYNVRRYADEFLFTDEEADATICSYKQTSFCATMIASYMVNLLVNFVNNQISEVERALPFYTEYSAETMYLKTLD